MRRNPLRLLAALLIGFVCILYPQSALAETLGSFEVLGEGTCSYDSGVLTISGGTITVTMAEGSSSTSDRIVVTGDADVTLDGVTIESTDEAALLVKPGVTATLALSGDNSLTGGNGYAAVEPEWNKTDDVVTMANLTITGDGSLNATGGTNSAGIGGSKSRNGVYGNITIEGGTIVANANGDAAAIGSSDNPANGTSSGSYKFIADRWGSIVINDGDITATATGTGAGIGGGNHSDSGEIIINGGDIDATGYAGIGAGLGSSKPDSEGKKGPGYYFADVTIKGGDVTATAHDGANGAGIGGGMYSDANVTINGGTVVAVGNYQNDNYHHGGAGIGGGYLGHAEVTITGGSVTATGGGAAAGIGSGGAPNGNSKRGSSSRTGKTTCDGTTVTITGGEVVAEGGPKGGAGIGGGVGADTVTVDISGGSVEAQGGKSTQEDMRGGAGIGSGFDASAISGETKYMPCDETGASTGTSTSVTITAGDVLSIGGWGASGIGSGAANVTAATITIDATAASIEAYADGTKFAIDTRQLNPDGSTTSITDGRTVTGDLLQGTFVKKYTQDDGKTQNPEGLKSIQVTNDETGASETLTNMPDGYRSFATDVTASGKYTVYTDEASIGEGEGRFFSKCTTDVYDKTHIVERNVQFQTDNGALSDNFYLYPVKSVVVTKEVIVEDGLAREDVDGTFYFALWIVSKGEYQRDPQGNIWTESITVTDGVPEGKAYFVDVDDTTYGVWEVADAQGTELPDVNRHPFDFGSFSLVRITTEDSSSGSDNDATISPEHWTDKVTVKNTLRPKVGELDVTKKVVIPSGEKASLAEQSFTFTVNLRGADGIALTSAYFYAIYQSDGTETGVTGTLSDGGTLSLSDGQTAKITGIPQGATYAVTEQDPGTSWQVTSTGASGSIAASAATAAFTNTYQTSPGTVSRTVVKRWDDQNNKYGARPKSIVVRLSNGSVVTLNDANGWTATISGLPKYENGKEIVYTWKEEQVPSGYTVTSAVSKGEVTTITNTYNASKKKASVLPKTGDPMSPVAIAALATVGVAVLSIARELRLRRKF